MSPKSRSSTSAREDRRARAEAAARAAAAAERRRSILNGTATVAGIAVVVGVLFAIFQSNDGGSSGSSDAGRGSGTYVYQVGSPGPGDQAINFTLPSTKGGSVSLADFKGKTVLTYWHEGLGCQPCWDQIRAIEQNEDALKSAGIDEFVSITSGPVDALAQKMADDNLSAVTLADTDLAISQQYQMNQFGMMGSRDGHTFLLIGPDGKILWRADYGGAPNYTMFVPVDTMLSQLKANRLW